MTDLKSTYNFFKRSEPPIQLILVHSRKVWESKMMQMSGYDFSQEELDQADPKTGFIGERMNVKCYLTKLL